MRRKVSRLFYWAVTMVVLTGVFVVFKSSLGLPDDSQSDVPNGHFLRLRDKINHGQKKIQEKSIPFIVPVENPGVVRKLEGNSNHRTRDVVQEEVEVKPVIEPQDILYKQPYLPKTNMRKLDEVRNFSKVEEEEGRNLSHPKQQKKTTKNFNTSQRKGSESNNFDDDAIVRKIVNRTLQKKPSELTLDDIFIGVKTTRRYHKSRLDILVKTWFQNAKHQTFFFTDGYDPEWQNKTGGQMIITDCPTDHHRQSLCCKFSKMYQMYLESGKKWFCHLDDDNYLNVDNLLSVLSEYPPEQDHYLGRSSLNHAIETIDREDGMKTVRFWFATGGAGFCISRALALNMSPYAGGGLFTSMCNRIRLPDDVTVGFISEHLVKTKLTSNKLFNSHLQFLKLFKGETLKKQITLSYGLSEQRSNVVTVPEAIFTTKEDPSRFLSLHCYLYPDAGICHRQHAVNNHSR